MHIVITGALGYIGSRLRQSPWPRDVDAIVGIDNRPAREPAPPAGKASVIEADVRTADLAALLRPGDTLIHLAALTGSEASLGDRDRVAAVNVGGTVRVAHACVAARANLLFVSSTSVYGGLDGNVDETSSLESYAPQNPYADSKLEAERRLAAIAAAQPLRYGIVRFGTIYGPSPVMRCHTAITRFCRQAATGQPLSVWRTAMDQQRPYLDLADAVAAIKFVIGRRLFDGRICNVVTETATVRDAIACIRAYVPDARIEEVDSPAMTSRSQVVSCGPLRAAGFEFRGNLRDGIRQTLEALAAARQPIASPRAAIGR